MRKNRLRPSRRDPVPLLGAHMSVAGGLSNAIDRALRVEATVLQIFVKNANRWTAPPLDDREAAQFIEKRASSGLRSVVAHDSYLINLASPWDELWLRSIDAFVDEMARCAALGLEVLVTHPGAHMNSGEAEGVRRVAEALDRISERCATTSVGIALETTAGQGTTLGYSFEHLRDIIGTCRKPDSIYVCLDTCHLFAAGYDFSGREGYQRMIEQVEETVGVSKVKVIHLNDSKRGLGSRVDRHAHIGEGTIGLEGFGSFLNEPRFDCVPKILETPKGEDLSEDRKNLETLRSLIRTS